MPDTLHVSVVRDALMGASRRECPGGFIAYVGKRSDGRHLVEYVHCNTDRRIHALAWDRARGFVI